MTATVRKQRKRELILDRAFHVLRRYGFAKTTMEDIATSCGLKKTSLYYYFRDKEEVFAEIMRAHGERRLAVARQAAEQAEPHRRDRLADGEIPAERARRDQQSRRIDQRRGQPEGHHS